LRAHWINLSFENYMAVGPSNRLQEETMKRLILASMLAASVVCVPMVLADDASAPDSNHHFVKDSVITTKVKSKLAAKHLTTLTRIKVDTDENGVVWLSGHAPTQDAVDLAAMIAKNTDGVNSVHNDVVVQP
jgi:hyperosmotically inducible periplasmic protein